MARSKKQVERSNRRTAMVLTAVAVAVFGFGYALVPLYDLFCDITGSRYNVQASQATSAPGTQGETRQVTVEFSAHTSSQLPWEFRPLTREVKVKPGETVIVKYFARNTSSETVTGQAVPSVLPAQANSHFRKLECFCFSQQTLKPGEAKEMPVRFYVDQKLPAGVNTITLSYSFFRTDVKSKPRSAVIEDRAGTARRGS
ncbi:MAG: cytochrome c oxidase assembly protein [Pseudomonadota bacterium]